MNALLPIPGCPNTNKMCFSWTWHPQQIVTNTFFVGILIRNNNEGLSVVMSAMADPSSECLSLISLLLGLLLLWLINDWFLLRCCLCYRWLIYSCIITRCLLFEAKSPSLQKGHFWGVTHLPYFHMFRILGVYWTTSNYEIWPLQYYLWVSDVSLCILHLSISDLNKHK